MADSDSTNASVNPLHVAGELEGMQDTLRILNELTSDQACDWGGDDDSEKVGRMVENILVLTNTTRDKLNELSNLVTKVYKIGIDTTHVSAN